MAAAIVPALARLAGRLTGLRRAAVEHLRRIGRGAQHEELPVPGEGHRQHLSAGLEGLNKLAVAIEEVSLLVVGACQDRPAILRQGDAGHGLTGFVVPYALAGGAVQQGHQPIGRARDDAPRRSA